MKFTINPVQGQALDGSQNMLRMCAGKQFFFEEKYQMCD